MSQLISKKQVLDKICDLETRRELCNCVIGKSADTACPLHGEEIKYMNAYLQESSASQLNQEVRVAQLAHAGEFLLAMQKIKDTIGVKCDGKKNTDLMSSVLECMPYFDELLREVGYVPVKCVPVAVSCDVQPQPQQRAKKRSKTEK